MSTKPYQWDLRTWLCHELRLPYGSTDEEILGAVQQAQEEADNLAQKVVDLVLREHEVEVAREEALEALRKAAELHQEVVEKKSGGI